MTKPTLNQTYRKKIHITRCKHCHKPTEFSHSQDLLNLKALCDTLWEEREDARRKLHLLRMQKNATIQQLQAALSVAVRKEPKIKKALHDVNKRFKETITQAKNNNPVTDVHGIKKRK